MLCNVPLHYVTGGCYMIKVIAARGSALVMVLCVMTAITMLATVALRNSAYGLDLALKRLQYEQQFRAVDGLMQYAIAATQENYDALSTIAENIVISFDAWPPTKKKAPYSGKITFKAEEGVLLRAELVGAGVLLCALSCNVQRLEENSAQFFIVSNWRLDGGSAAKNSTH